MSTSKTLNGSVHLIPSNNEYDWGTEVSNTLIDIIDVLNGGWQEVTASGASTTINFDSGRNVKLNLNASTTLTLSNPTTGSGCCIYVKQGGSYTLSWPAAVKWKGGSAPTISTGVGKRDLVGLIYDVGDSIYLGDYSQDFS